MEKEPVTVIVRRRVKAGCNSDFEAAMREFIAFALSFPGHRDIHVLRPDHADGGDYTVVDKFADAGARHAFKTSAAYSKWMQRLAALTEGDPHIEEMGGLAGWFTLPEGTHARPPSRPKMAAVTFLGVYPLTSTLPPLFSGALPGWHPLLVNLVTTGVIVASLTWLIMPLLTRAFAPWLFPKDE